MSATAGEEEEISCPKEKLEEACKRSKACIGLLAKFEACEERVRSRPGTSETCTEELFDLTPCIDACVRIASSSILPYIKCWFCCLGVQTFV